MNKKEKIVDCAAALTESYRRWDYINSRGCSDPFWSDGVNMNLVRNHIIYYKNKLESEHTLYGFPDCYYRETPPETDNNYMACPDEIRENALKSMRLIDSDENLKYVREQSKNLSEKELKSLCIPAIIRYSESLRKAIADDDLITMRRYKTVSHYLEAFENAARRLKSPENTKPERQAAPDEDFMKAVVENQRTEKAIPSEEIKELQDEENMQLTLY